MDKQEFLDRIIAAGFDDIRHKLPIQRLQTSQLEVGDFLWVETGCGCCGTWCIVTNINAEHLQYVGIAGDYFSKIINHDIGQSYSCKLTDMWDVIRIKD